MTVADNDRQAPGGPHETVADRYAWLTGNEVAHILKFSPKTLANWASARPPRGPRFFKIGGQCRYRAADVLDWQDRQLAEESAQPQGW